ncbi:MAG: AbrB family transcriptional regulator [Inquilinus sp.]|nr:AbrB family transcriptional regulator [Inquilinus sp.]
MAGWGLPSPAEIVRAVRDTDYKRLIPALALGTAGGAIFFALELPLPWMLGAMLSTSAAALMGAPIPVPTRLRSVMVVILGIMLGGAFEPSILDNIGRWMTSLAGLSVYIVVSIAAGISYLRWVARYDPVTAYFAATPGGFNEMIMIGGAMGGSERTIALSHSLRVTLVVFTIPFLFRLTADLDQAAQAAATTVAAAGMAPVDWALLTGCIVGAPIAARLNIPAAVLVGPMLLSAGLHLFGLTDARPPAAMIAAAQIIIGTSVGGRFAGLALAQLARAALVGLGLTFVLLTSTVVFALLLNAITGIGIRDLILAYAPGGLAEMSLVALALKGDAAFVSTHHIARIILVVLLAPALFAALRRLGWSDPPKA